MYTSRSSSIALVTIASLHQNQLSAVSTGSFLVKPPTLNLNSSIQKGYVIFYAHRGLLDFKSMLSSPVAWSIYAAPPQRIPAVSNRKASLQRFKFYTGQLRVEEAVLLRGVGPLTGYQSAGPSSARPYGYNADPARIPRQGLRGSHAASLRVHRTLRGFHTPGCFMHGSFKGTCGASDIRWRLVQGASSL